MNDEDDIPLLTDLIQDGQPATTPGPDVDLLAEAAEEDEDMTIDLATHNLEGDGDSNRTDRPERGDEEAAPPLPEALGADGELASLDALEEDSSLQELIVEEQIRLILDKHMEAAYEEILRLIQHRIR